jgi:hypothetical protein
MKRSSSKRRAYSRRRHDASERPRQRRCEWCKELMPPYARVDARYGSDACRQAASRARRGLKHGWGGTTDREARRAATTGVVAVTGGRHG